MVDEKEQAPVASFRFRANFKSPTLEIHEGEYRRLFKSDEQPFAANTLEEAEMLRRDSHFVEVKDEQPAHDAGKMPALPADEAKAATGRRTPKPAAQTDNSEE